MKSKVLLGLGLVALLAMGSSFAGQASAEVLKVKIDFPFMVGTTNLPAGDYTFTAESNDQVIRVQGPGKSAAIADVITRLAALRMGDQSAHVVFDVMGNTYKLAEMWIPGYDGYVLVVTKGKHEHKVVNVER